MNAGFVVFLSFSLTRWILLFECGGELVGNRVVFGLFRQIYMFWFIHVLGYV